MKTSTIKLLLLFLLTGASVNASTISWVNPVSGLWSNPANWSTSSLPGINDTVYITLAGTYTVTLDQNVNISKLVVGGGGLGIQKLESIGTWYTLTSNHSILCDVNGKIKTDQTTFQSSGIFTNNGEVQANYYNTFNCAFVNNALFRITHSTNVINGTFYNSSLATLSSDAENYIATIIFSNGIVNAGLIKLGSLSCYQSSITIGGGTLQNNFGGTILSEAVNNCGTRFIFGPVQNDGHIQVDYPLTIQTSSSSINTGTINISGANTLTFNSGTFNLNSGAITGSGTLRFENSILNLNMSSFPSITSYFSGSSINGAGTKLNYDTLQFSASNYVNVNIENKPNSLFRISHYNNFMSGNILNENGATILCDAFQYVSAMAFSGSFINSGLILLESATCYSSSVGLTTGSILNTNTGIIRSSNSLNCGTRFIYGAVDNQGLLDIQYPLTIQSPNNSSNSGNIIFSNSSPLTYDGGSITRTGGNITGTGKMIFLNTIANMNVSTLPPVEIEMTGSTLTSTFLPITNNGILNIFYSNVISAAIFNTGTIRIRHFNNSMTGALTTSTSSQIISDASSYVSALALSAGFTNNGLLELKTTTCYGSSFEVSTGNIINSSSGVIRSSSDMNCGTRFLYAAVDNQGLIDVQYPLTIQSTNASYNNSNINVVSNASLKFLNGSLTWNGGLTSGHGKLIMENNNWIINTPAFPLIYTQLFGATLSASNPVESYDSLHIYYSNNINLNLINKSGALLMISHWGNIMNGNFTNDNGAILQSDAASYHSNLQFNGNVLNHGLFLFKTITCYNAYITKTGTPITNFSDGVILSSPSLNCGTRYIDGPVDNQGFIDVKYPFTIYQAANTSTNSGSINIDNGASLTYYNGNMIWNSGAVTGTGKLYYYNCIWTHNMSSLPNVYTSMTYSTLNTLPACNLIDTLHLIHSNTINGNLDNNSGAAFIISHLYNAFNGTYHNSIGSYLISDAGSVSSDIIFNNGFVNDGTILLTTITCYSPSISLSSGQITNSVTGVIKSSNLLNCGSRRINGAVINQGMIDVDYDLTIASSNQSQNNGNVTIDTLKSLTYESGSMVHQGGVISGPGKLRFSSCNWTVNTPNLPNIYTEMTASNLFSTQVNLLHTLHLQNTNTINCDLNNLSGGILRVSHTNNIMFGIFSNNNGALLEIDAAGFNSNLEFSNGFSNHGIIKLRSAICYSPTLTFLNNGTLHNASDGQVLFSNDIACGNRYFNGKFENDGFVDFGFNTYINTTNFKNKIGGIFRGNSWTHFYTGKLVNAGILEPGPASAKWPVTGDIKNESTSTFKVQIGGLTVGTQYDKLEITGQDSLNGTLDIQLINGFIPALGDSFVVRSFTSSVGTFSAVSGASIPGGLVFNVFYRPTYVVLRAGNPPNLTINASAGPNGSITPSGAISVVYNGSQSFTIVPDFGYTINDVLVDGISVGAVSSYSFSNVTMNHSISASFITQTWPIYTSSSGGGSISPNGTVLVNEYANQLFNFNPNPCKIVDSVFIDGNYIGNPTSHQFNSVTDTHYVHVVFADGPAFTYSGPLSFCEGGSVDLIAGPGYTNYAWSNGVSTASNTVSLSGIYTVTVTGPGGCTSSRSILVTVHPKPIITFNDIYPLDGNHVCESSSIQSLNSFVSSNHSGYFSFSGPGITNFNFTGYLNPSVAGVGIHSIQATTVDSNNCSSSISQTVEVDQAALINATDNFVLCNSLIAPLSVTIGGSASSVQWSTNGSGNFGNPMALNTNYILSSADSLAGTVSISVTTDNPTNACPAVSDQLTVTYNPDAIANAGSDVPICVGSNFNLYGNIIGYPALPLWSTSGSGSFNNPASINPIYSASPADLLAGSIKLFLTPIDPNGYCTFNSDSLEVWFDPQFTVDAGSYPVLCGDTSILLQGAIGNGATSATWSTGINGGTFDNVNSLQTIYYLSAFDKANGTATVYLTTNDPTGPCPAISDAATIRYKFAAPDAGPEGPICLDTLISLNGQLNLSPAGSFTPQWSTTGTGYFDNSTLSITNYHASLADFASGKIYLVYNAIDPLNECTFPADSLEVWFDPHYMVEAGAPSSVCFGSGVTLNGSIANGVTSVLWTTNGFGSFDDPTLLNATYTSLGGDSLLTDSITFWLTSNDPMGPCVSVMDSMRIKILPVPHATAGTNSPICVGADLNLTASVGVSYVWTGPNGFTSTSQNIIRTNADATMMGDYQVIVGNSYGCVDTAITTAYFGNCGCVPPLLSTNPTDPTCLGATNGSVDLLLTGGTSPFTFNWSNGAITEDLSSLSNGIYTVTVTADGGCTATQFVVINNGAPLSPITIGTSGPTTFCSGSVVLDAGPGFTNYYWNSGQSSQTINVNSSGIYSVTATNNLGCSASSNNVQVNAGGSLPNIQLQASGPLHFCIGSSVILNAGLGYDSYLWSNGTTSSSITVNQNGVYYVTVTQSGCTAQSDSASVTVSTKIPATTKQVFGPPAACPAVSYTFYINKVARAISYNWQVPAGCLVNGNPAPYSTQDTMVTISFVVPSNSSAFSGWNVCVSATNACGTTNSKCTWVRYTTSVPGLINGPTLVCLNNTYSYSFAPVTGANFYRWTLPTGAEINGQTGIVTTSNPSANITFTNSYQSGTICVSSSALGCVYSANRCLKVNAQLASVGTITGPKNGVCAGTYNYSHPIVVGASAYQWTAPLGVLINGQPSPVTTPSTSANITFPNNFISGDICVAAVSVCGSPGIQKCLTGIIGKPSKPGSIVGDNIVCALQQNVGYFVNPVAGATIYAWLPPPGSMIASGINTTNITVNYGIQAGSLSVMAQNSCGSSSASLMSVMMNCREESEVDRQFVSVYPNPATQQLNLVIQSETDNKLMVGIYDSRGKLVHQQNYSTQHGEQKITIDISNLSEGIYLIDVNVGNSVEKMKFVKIK